MKRLIRALSLFVALPVVLSAGCGSDDNKNGNVTGVVVDVRDGTWSVTTTTSASGGGLCDLFEPGTTTEDLVICELNDEIEDPENGVTCTVTERGASFSFSCSGGIDLGCDISFEITGSGEYTETTFEYMATIVVTSSGDPQFCVNDECTVMIEETGTWTAAIGSCTGAAPSLPRAALRNAIGRARNSF